MLKSLYIFRSYWTNFWDSYHKRRLLIFTLKIISKSPKVILYILIVSIKRKLLCLFDVLFSGISSSCFDVLSGALVVCSTVAFLVLVSAMCWWRYRRLFNKKLRHSHDGTSKHTQTIIDATPKKTAIDQQQHSCETLIC
jgi:hypothetical protein